MRCRDIYFCVLAIGWLIHFTAGRIHCQDGADAGNLDVIGKTDTTSKTDKLEKLLDLADKDIAQLSQVRVNGMTGSPSLDTPVSTVSRQPSTIGQTAAAVYVVTNEMIRRSTAKTIPDVLRLVPGVDVARINASTWAVSIRGFNNAFANKLLVMIDGRTIYNTMFGGVYWSEQDVLLEDVDHIEVIRGPGASVWGSNAVNGVINIVTKDSKDTQGTYIESGAGTEELGFSSLRWGGGNGDDLHYRFYGKWYEWGPGVSADALPAWDGWHQARGGFRMDWEVSEDDKITFQGDYYNGYSGDKTEQTLLAPPYKRFLKDTIHQEGANALLRWSHTIDQDSDWAAQVFYDRMEHCLLTRQVMENHNVFDFDFQHRFPAGDRHEWIWGCGYRNTTDQGPNTSVFRLIPPGRSYKIISYFVQDRITLVEDKWFLTLGCKFEHNDFTKFEYQPTVQLLWAVDDEHSIWGSVSRAVRTPDRSKLDTYMISPPFITDPIPFSPFIIGNPNLLSEDVITYELGYREQTTERFSWDLALFLNDYRNTDAFEAGTPFFDPTIGFMLLPSRFVNAQSGRTYGFEVSANYDLSSRWKLRGSYSFLDVNMNPLQYPYSDEYGGRGSPRNLFNLQSSWDLGRKWELDFIGRYVDNQNCWNELGQTITISNYFAADVRLAWKPYKNFEWSVVGRNLLAGTHPEFGDDLILNTIHTEVQQEVYSQIIWRH
ncbi:MAG: TonB-dependent receptor [Pirellulales bacterium]|nr:TonB-dependent receptor [Pirellulales bacterium]